MMDDKRYKNESNHSCCFCCICDLDIALRLIIATIIFIVYTVSSYFLIVLVVEVIVNCYRFYSFCCSCCICYPEIDLRQIAPIIFLYKPILLLLIIVYTASVSSYFPLHPLCWGYFLICYFLKVKKTATLVNLAVTPTTIIYNLPSSLIPFIKSRVSVS